MRCNVIVTAAVFVLAMYSRAADADSVVAADGSGDFRTVQEALVATPAGVDAAHPWIVHIKPGTYHELVRAQREKRFVTLRGDDAGNTTITYELNASVKGPDGKPIGTFNTPTVTIDADDFTIENLTLANSAGAIGQALALRVDGDRCVFRRCRFIGWQDTILVSRGRQFFEDCTIAGCTDFIFGGATSFFERCDIHILGDGYITAASTPDVQMYGLVFSHCRIIGDRPGLKTFLGRAWRAHAATTWLNTDMSDVVEPAGWHHWNETNGSARYSEFYSKGPGGDSSQRVDWSEHLTETQAADYTIEKVLAGGDNWKPAAGAAAAAPPPPMPAALPFPLPEARASRRRATTRPSTQPGGTTVPAAATRPSSTGPLQPPIPPLTTSMNLWPGDVPHAAVTPQAERDDGTGRIWNVSVPGILVYLPAQTPPDGGRTALIACPGGSYTHLTRLVGADGTAGTFCPQGIAVIALKYRLKPASTDVEADALADGRRAIRLVRAHAAEWAINPHKIGLVGWSAGANLALNLATHPDTAATATDDVDRQSDRPDFIALLSPWPSGHAAEFYPVTSDTPPAFICTAQDDKTAPPVFAMKIATAYTVAHALIDIHVVPTGGHGSFTIGAKTDGSEWAAWLYDWMQKSHFAE